MSPPTQTSSYTISVRRDDQGRGGSLFLHERVRPGHRADAEPAGQPLPDRLAGPQAPAHRRGDRHHPVPRPDGPARGGRHRLRAAPRGPGAGGGRLPRRARGPLRRADPRLLRRPGRADRPRAPARGPAARDAPVRVRPGRDDGVGPGHGARRRLAGAEPPQRAVPRARVRGPVRGHARPVAKTIRVTEHQSMLDAIEAAGVEAPYMCRGGACGECETEVLACEGTDAPQRRLPVGRGQGLRPARSCRACRGSRARPSSCSAEREERRR